MATKQVQIMGPAGDKLAEVTAAYGPNVIVVRRLGWRRLAEAQKAQSKEALSNIREMGGPQFVKELQDSIRDAGGREAIEKAAERDPLSSYDLGALLASGIESMDGEAPSKEQIDELELDTVQTAGRTVLRLSRPALFETPEEQGND